MMRLACLAALLISLTGTASAGDKNAELARTWNAAQVWLPGEVAAVSVDAIPSAPPPRAIVLYAHGCDGPSRITTVTARFLAKAGYLVVAPDSFAREDKPTSCDPKLPRGGLHRAVLGWRQDEMRFALTRLQGMDNLAGVPLILMGHSEGAITAATLIAPGIDMRIIEGWTCHAGWPEYRGLNGPAGQPVLALLGEDDPWFRLPFMQGDCGSFMWPASPQVSQVYRAPSYLAGKHWLSSDRDVQVLILDFIAEHLFEQGQGGSE